LYRLYRDYPLLEGERVFSIHASLTERRRWLRRPRRLVRFSVDGRVPHQDLPAEQALAVLEWGLNLVIALRYHVFLMLHSAVVERDGQALLLPAWPGHGKTTLCAALVHRGWRLLSDEFGLLRPDSTKLVPIPRPMPLKNESIHVIRTFAPDAELGPVIPNTRKGTVVHVKPPPASIARATEHAQPSWIIFPRWMSGASLTVEAARPIESFMMLATNAFNYELLGERAFETVRDLVDRTRSYRLVYSDLEAAVGAIDRLTTAHGR
jgi:HprK-related kinase A